MRWAFLYPLAVRIQCVYSGRNCGMSSQCSLAVVPWFASGVERCYSPASLWEPLVALLVITPGFLLGLASFQWFPSYCISPWLCTCSHSFLVSQFYRKPVRCQMIPHSIQTVISNSRHCWSITEHSEAGLEIPCRLVWPHPRGKAPAQPLKYWDWKCEPPHPDFPTVSERQILTVFYHLWFLTLT